MEKKNTFRDILSRNSRVKTFMAPKLVKANKKIYVKKNHIFHNLKSKVMTISAK